MVQCEEIQGGVATLSKLPDLLKAVSRNGVLRSSFASHGPDWVRMALLMTISANNRFLAPLIHLTLVHSFMDMWSFLSMA